MPHCKLTHNDTPNGDSNNQVQVQACVDSIAGTKAYLTLMSREQINCKQCQQGKGCQSFSIGQWLFGNQPIAVQNAEYQLGQILTISFPKQLLLQMLCCVLGLPLASFILLLLSANLLGELMAFAIGLGGAMLTGMIGQTLAKTHLLKYVHLYPQTQSS